MTTIVAYYDRRIDELLASNNALLERARKAEAELKKSPSEISYLRTEMACLNEMIDIRDKNIEAMKAVENQG